MKCPHCEYENGGRYVHNTNFYEISSSHGVKMVRDWSHPSPSELDIIGCPECKKLFMEF